ncbi:hypothetical protein [Methanocella arvoryzae]|uniref:DUF4352 domain-containing protein n=1 Tax=Methanocella arvoryzae (strain DSM 22066 / NBRC 105507 / MRE50) TaxID=351160 RepID=Q0W8Y5_METAR|nr:hypothetical protein [Methanocella arvoryzae]CAJ35141.1 hypothetical protein LRC122 [Methanocella arvoryzae MRE50]
MMNGHLIRAMVLMVSLTLILLTSGCTQPASPSPSPSYHPTLPATSSAQVASPTPVPGSDEANINFTYIMKTYPKQYEGLTPNPGELIYVFDVKVDSDKPVQTDDSWFGIEYRKNATQPIQDLEPNTVFRYPSKTIGDGSGPAEGRLIIALPAPESGSLIRPYYYKPVNQQHGEYLVKTKVYGILRTS